MYVDAQLKLGHREAITIHVKFLKSWSIDLITCVDRVFAITPFSDLNMESFLVINCVSKILWQPPAYLH